MKLQDILGYICLFIAFIFYNQQVTQTDFTIALFFNGMALGFFGNSLYSQFVNRKKVRVKAKKIDK
jgi:hypothetical protein